MFRKLISNLHFSPSLIGQIGFYARRLHHEETTRRLGLIFTALAMVIQFFTIVAPPESANAASGNDIIYGGFKSKSQLLGIYDKDKDSAGHTDIQEIFKYFGLTRSDITNSKEGTFNSRDFNNTIYSAGRLLRSGGATNKVPGTSTTVYTRKTSIFDSSAWSKKNGNTYKALIGKRAVDGKWFAIMYDCGNPAFIAMPPKPGAKCSNLVVTSIDKNEYVFKASSATTGIATISNYKYTIKNSANKVIYSTTKKSTNKTDSLSYTFSTQGKYTVKVSVTTSEGVKTAESCEKVITISPEPEKVLPAAECSNLEITQIDRTNFKLKAVASTANNATVSSYKYTITNSLGKVVYSTTQNSKETTNSISYTAKNEGEYTAKVEVTTSEGVKTNSNCLKELIVSPEPRCPLNPNLTESHPDCKPCEDNENLWYKDDLCTSQFNLTKTVSNITQATPDANKTTVKAGDRIEYKLSVKNIGNATGSYTIQDNLNDVLEYADLVDAGGGILLTKKDGVPVEKINTISWPSIELKPNETVNKIVSVQIKKVIPATTKGSSNPESYNCQLVNDFSNMHTELLVDCPRAKVVEQITQELPKTGASENIIFAGILISVVVYFYARSRQMKEEVRLIRRNLNTGSF